jgi:AcrR family transcriptional regulator
MPYPSKISREAVIELARQMIEDEGVDRLSVNILAAQLGVKTPSLYRYVKNKTDLLRAVNEATFAGIFQAIGPALDSPGTAEQRIYAIAHAYRYYAHAHPITYGLAYTNTIAELRPDEAEQEQAVLPFQALVAEISGEEESLPALRGLLALIHGFVMLELAGQLRRGGDLTEAFEKSVRAYIAGWDIRSN